MPLEDSHKGWVTWMCHCHWRIHMKDGSPGCVNAIRGFTWRMGHLDVAMPLEDSHEGWVTWMCQCH
eukprot:1055635-Pyramimonas_sp.AAC.2